MFCKSCGAELKEDASFCNVCGTPVGEVKAVHKTEEDKKEDNVLRLEIKPTFNVGYQLLKTLWNIFFTLLIIDIFFIDVTDAIVIFPTLGWGIVAVVSIIYLVKLFFDKVQYKNASYKFYKTKVEYIDGFLNKEQKQLKYEHIREVSSTQNIIERMFNLGKIKLYTSASGIYDNRRRNHSQERKNGIYIHCVKDVDDKLKEVKALLDEIE